MWGETGRFVASTVTGPPGPSPASLQGCRDPGVEDSSQPVFSEHTCPRVVLIPAEGERAGREEGRFRGLERTGGRGFSRDTESVGWTYT